MSTEDPYIQVTKAERKKMIAREHNRQYQESKDNPQKQEVVKDTVISTVQGYRKALGI